MPSFRFNKVASLQPGEDLQATASVYCQSWKSLTEAALKKCFWKKVLLCNLFKSHFSMVCIFSISFYKNTSERLLLKQIFINVEISVLWKNIPRKPWRYILSTVQNDWNKQMKSKYRISYPEVLCERNFVKCFAKFTVKHLCRSIFFIYFIKIETPTHVFSCEFCEIFKNIF